MANDVVIDVAYGVIDDVVDDVAKSGRGGKGGVGEGSPICQVVTNGWWG